jgi:very-short-patch-repair endonuclease
MKNKSKHFLYTEQGRLYLVEEYVTNNKSAYELATILGTYANFIYRALRHHNIERKDKGSAQRLALQTGRTKHPTLGKKHDIVTKNRIGESMHDYWNGLSKKEFQKRVDNAREAWYKYTEEERTEWRKKSHEKLREAAIEGSKAEKALVAALLASGFKVQVHKKMVLSGSDMSVDIFLPGDLTVIEINGPSHYYPLFGEQILEQTINRDLKKRELLMGSGFKFIEISNESGYYSKTVLDKFCVRFIPFLKDFVKTDEQFTVVSVEEILNKKDDNVGKI